MSSTISDTDFNFCAVLAEMLRTRTAIGKTGKRFDSLEALSTENNLSILRKLQIDLRPKRTLEVGLAFGGSCLVFTQTHRDLGSSPTKQHIALDPFQESVWDGAALVAVERAALSGFLDFRAVFSSQELPRMLDNGEKIDLAYVDGSHLVEDVFVDFYFVSRLLSENGVALFDDSSLPHVHKVLRFIRTNLRSSFAEIDLGQYRQDAGKSIKYRAARLLGKQQLAAFRRIGPPCRKWDAPFSDF